MMRQWHYCQSDLKVFIHHIIDSQYILLNCN